MNREEANYYLKSSGFSDEQIDTIAKAYAEPKTGHCVWCSSPYRIEYYWIDREGNTASYQDEDRHIVATGIAKYCPNCGARMIEPQESEG